ncbi:polyphosphate polymerase domain-containing protein [Colwellia sp. MSW7]|uniref:Polyphosphate polymerase domain-containing protein n=1 Tax=Colwellia maritima TaxID=2912588 RepID=A0ABS9X6H6_9GAMM|nr:polyphosphate polymerase domain-containing protein [Colwellia maritima]MCI2285819.1 polyphosphate polymerase domain-containing protein [Colwellia maritima]
MQNIQSSYRDLNANFFSQPTDSECKNKIEIPTDVNCQSINDALRLFTSYGLSDLKNANLMNRVDSKFVLPITFLPDLLLQLKQYYSVLEINNNRISSYHNQYFDTPDMSLYQDHHNGKLNRYKVRRRRYIDTDTEFLEVKLKNNKKRTIKNRMKLTGEETEYARCVNFINEQIQVDIDDLDLSNLDINQQGGYQRIALANEAQAERLTLDFDLWYENRRGNNKVKLPGFFIAELKQQKISKRSPFYQLMSANNIFPTTFSKYCIGCALLYKSSIKSNRFKPILSRIKHFNRIEHVSFLKSN